MIVDCGLSFATLFIKKNPYFLYFSGRMSSSQDDLDDDGGSLYAQSVSGAAGKTETDNHEHFD